MSRTVGCLSQDYEMLSLWQMYVMCVFVCVCIRLHTYTKNGYCFPLCYLARSVRISFHFQSAGLHNSIHVNAFTQSTASQTVSQPESYVWLPFLFHFHLEVSRMQSDLGHIVVLYLRVCQRSWYTINPCRCSIERNPLFLLVCVCVCLVVFFTLPFACTPTQTCLRFCMNCRPWWCPCKVHHLKTSPETNAGGYITKTSAGWWGCC